MFLILFRCAGVSKNKKPLVLGAGDTSRNPEIIEMRGFRVSHEQIEKLIYQIEAE